MYAVIETGGKQYRVQKGSVVDVELRPVETSGSAKAAKRTVTFDRVLFVGGGKSAHVGTPLVDGARVTATVVADTRAPKVLIFKKKRRKGYRRTKGHRQNLLRLRIDSIDGVGA
jgi:large subunit ribosomal protein L21